VFVFCSSIARFSERPVGLPQSRVRTRVRPTTNRESGSALILLPAIVVIVTFLGALTVSHATLFLAQRELFAIAQSAANNGVSAIDVERFRTTGDFIVDPSALQTFVAAEVAQHVNDLVRVETIETGRLTDSTVEVRLTGSAPTAFLRQLPGISYRIAAHATARAVERG
jgi:hypothetical protein